MKRAGLDATQLAPRQPIREEIAASLRRGTNFDVPLASVKMAHCDDIRVQLVLGCSCFMVKMFWHKIRR